MRTQCNGQGLIELIIGTSSVLLILIILLPLLGKFVETQQATGQAARYLAWERTVWFQNAPSGTTNAAVKSDDDLKREIHWRFFSNDSVTLSSDDSLDTKKWTVKDHINPMLASRRTSQNKVVALMSNGVENSNSGSGSSESTASEDGDSGGTDSENDSSDQLLTVARVSQQDTPTDSAIDGVLTGLNLLGGNFKSRVNHRGLQASEVSFTYAKLPGIEPFDDENFNLTSTSKLFVLSDGWNVSGRGQAIRTSQTLVPSALLNWPFLTSLRNTIGALPIARELRNSWLQFGLVTSEPVPAQRLCSNGEDCE